MARFLQRSLAEDALAAAAGIGVAGPGSGAEGAHGKAAEVAGSDAAAAEEVGGAAVAVLAAGHRGPGAAPDAVLARGGAGAGTAARDEPVLRVLARRGGDAPRSSQSLCRGPWTAFGSAHAGSRLRDVRRRVHLGAVACAGGPTVTVVTRRRREHDAEAMGIGLPVTAAVGLTVGETLGDALLLGLGRLWPQAGSDGPGDHAQREAPQRAPWRGCRQHPRDPVYRLLAHGSLPLRHGHRS